MPFHFTLDTLLHYRQSIEHQQELRLQTANQQVAGMRHLIAGFDDRIRGIIVDQFAQLRAGITAVELHFAQQCLETCRRQRQDAARELARLENLRDQQQKVFQHARRQREAIDSLRDRQWQRYTRDAARREQRVVDDLFLLRRAYLRRG